MRGPRRAPPRCILPLGRPRGAFRDEGAPHPAPSTRQWTACRDQRPCAFAASFLHCEPCHAAGGPAASPRDAARREASASRSPAEHPPPHRRFPRGGPRTMRTHGVVRAPGRGGSGHTGACTHVRARRSARRRRARGALAHPPVPSGTRRCGG